MCKETLKADSCVGDHEEKDQEGWEDEGKGERRRREKQGEDEESLSESGALGLSTISLRRAWPGISNISI